jgi:hypothetical protein
VVEKCGSTGKLLGWVPFRPKLRKTKLLQMMGDEPSIREQDELSGSGSMALHRLLYRFVEVIGSGRHSDLIGISVLVAVWALAALVVDLVGNFPLNDDWAYAFAVRALVQHGVLHLSGWTATNLIAQLLWGTLFCLPFGFSFTALRFSTLLLAMLGVLATYALLREAQAKPGPALIGAITLAFNPIYFALAFTFMTDVPFTAAAVASSWLLLRGLRRGRRVEIIAGVALAMAAILIRQIGLAIPIAFAIAYVVKRGLRIRRLIEAIIPVVRGFRCSSGVPRLVALARSRSAKFWISNSDSSDSTNLALGHDRWRCLDDHLLHNRLHRPPVASFLIAVYLTNIRARGPVFYFGAAGAGAILTLSLAARRVAMPLHGNVLGKGGIGWDMAPSPPLFRVFLTFLACSGALHKKTIRW